MSDIRLNFINNSNDQNNSKVVMFQKNVAESFDELAVAWKVIKNCGQGDNHPFVYEKDFSVAAINRYGNYTPALAAKYGERFELTNEASGNVLVCSKKPASSKNEMEI